MENKNKTSILRSVKGKLILLGLVAIVTTITLGFTGISVLNSNNKNNQVLADVNNVNLLQNENRTLETTFLYDLEPSHYDTIQSNLNSMNNAAQNAIAYGKASYGEDLSAIASDISTSIDNTAKLASSITERSFQPTAGMYAEFLESDEALTDAFNLMAAEAEWVDGSWNEIPLSSLNTVEVDGKAYRKFTYETDIASSGKRNYLIIRAGNNGILYTGNVYITNIKFDGSTQIDLSTVTVEDLSESYGEGYTDLAVSTFNGDNCISFKGRYTDANENWQETSIEIPIISYPMESSKKVSYDIYFEETELPVIKLAIAFTEKYEFEENLDLVNSMFHSYSTLVAEGNDTGTYADDIAAKLEEIKSNSALYTTNSDAISAATAALNAKEEAFQKILTYDKDILSLKADNNSLNNALTTTIGDIRAEIEQNTESSKNSMFALIVVVFLIGVVLVVLLTVFVIFSVQKSIKNFRSTLHEISDGHITVKATTGTGDEFDVFGRSLNQMTDKLTDVLGSAISIAREVNISGGNLENMALATSETSTQIDVSVSEIAKGAGVQADDVDQSTQQISHLGNLMDEMVTQVSELDDTSVNMKHASDEAVSILSELSSSNEKMTDGVHNISEQISRTNDSVKKIEEAVSLISSIASQTNLLSLNASIEAARAGEAGRGFAVVASEIQQLAEQSNTSANTIYQVISTLTSDFKTTLQIMQEVEEATNAQNEKLMETQKQFEIVNSGIAQSRDKTSIIKSSIDECNQVRVNVSELMTSLSSISAENAAASSETADSMQTLNQTITKLLDESRKLLDISSKLEEDMEFFEL